MKIINNTITMNYDDFKDLIAEEVSKELSKRQPSTSEMNPALILNDLQKDRLENTWHIDSDLFQFIQWSYSKPYNIQELIEEYEKYKKDSDYFKVNVKNVNQSMLDDLRTESKKTEVSRNKEWLKREIHKELESWHGVEGGIDGNGINEIMLLIDELDEPEERNEHGKFI